MIPELVTDPARTRIIREIIWTKVTACQLGTTKLLKLLQLCYRQNCRVSIACSEEIYFRYFLSNVAEFAYYTLTKAPLGAEKRLRIGFLQGYVRPP